ncbi:hypothetical protein MMC27_005098 [Xylographa pallens]|nr:hypothetical protein [Xylographa pallens]
MSSVPTAAVGEPGRSGTVGQRPKDSEPHAGVVLDAENDIAKSELLERITVGVPGRQRFQKIFVRKSGSGAGGKTTIPYKAADDAPAEDRTLSIIPTTEEIESRAETLEFLVVGLVLAANPLQYSTKASGPSRNKQRDADRTARGVLPAQSNVLRAIVPTTDLVVHGSIKYYVACHQLHGLCNLRVISSDAIFYFQEIWDSIPEDVPVKDRRRQLGAACKLHAARDKKAPERALISLPTGSEPTASNVISIDRTSNAANVVMMQYCIYAMTKDPSAIVALQKTLEDILPDLLSRPTDEGILGFYSFDEVLKKEDAIKATSTVMAIYPTMPKLDPQLVLELHAALRRTGLGGKLPYKSFIAFLRWSHDRAAAGWDPQRLDAVVEAIIHDIEIADEVQEITTDRTVSKLTNGPSDLTPLLSGVRVALNEIVEYFRAQSKALREQHGGLAKHASIEELMIKIGNCVDKTALKALEEQVFAIHAEQLATANSNGAKYIQRCIDLIDQALAIAA